MDNKMSWEELLDSEGRRGDGRWARLTVGPDSEVEAQVRGLEQSPLDGGAYVMIVRGERCRNSESLFSEWDHVWEGFGGTPDYSGNNWDGFGESLEELVERDLEGEDPSWSIEQPDTVLVLILRSPELLQDEPKRLWTLVKTMRTAALGLAWEDKDKPRLAELRILFQCEPEEAESLAERLTRAGLDFQ